MINNAKMKFGVGALLYSPALNVKTANAVIKGDFGSKYSIALCLEDTISEDMVAAAEQQAVSTIRQIRNASQTQEFYLPKLFVRVRNPEQLERIFNALQDSQDIITGFILPKYTVSNAQAYHDAILAVNEASKHTIYIMPILESGDLVDLKERCETLCHIKDCVDSISDLVLNIRVGGNDLSNEFALRRHTDETIYDMLPVAQLLGDILTVFSRQYVVSGPVWEYFTGQDNSWEIGLRREIKCDLLNGFIGKTVIHPKQIRVVNEMLRIKRNDYEDAVAIMGWDSSGLQVAKSISGTRMNEVRTHINWAERTLLLAELYGIE